MSRWLWYRATQKSLASTDGVRYDCRKCGACCLFFGIDCYHDDPTPDKHKMPGKGWKRFLLTVSGQLPAVRKRAIGYADGFEPLQMSEAACACLKGTIGASVECSIYDVRPYSCRRFEMGSHNCEACRYYKGLPVSAAFMRRIKNTPKKKAEVSAPEVAK